MARLILTHLGRYTDAMLAALRHAVPDVVFVPCDPGGAPAELSDILVRLSPLIFWSSPDTIARTLALFVENLRRYDADESLEGVVDVEAGY